MPALKLVPMPPPEEVVAREEQPPAGQPNRTPPPRLSAFPWQKGRKPSLHFDDVRGVTVVFRFVVPRAKKAPKSQPADKRGGYARFGASVRKTEARYQYGLPNTVAPVVRDRRLESTRLKRREREEMEKDVAKLEAAGVYKLRPIRGNGVSGDCPKGPCPWVRCAANLFITVRPNGSIKMNFPGKEIDQVGETCALRAAAGRSPDDPPMPFEELGPMNGMTDSRAETITNGALRKLKRAGLLDVFRQEGKG